jgi:hypothetical protein
MSDYGMPSAPWNQPYGTPGGTERYTLRFVCDCGHEDLIEAEADHSVGACEWLEIPWCPDCDKEIEGDGERT